MVVTANRQDKTQSEKAQTLVLWLEDVAIGDIALVVDR